jgi:hypothetical protein
MNIVVDQTGLVLMWSDTGKPTPPSGATLIEISDEQAKAFASTPNTRGLVFNGASFTALPALPPPPPLNVDQKLALIGLTRAALKDALK